MYKDGGAGSRRRNKAKEVWPGKCEMAKTRNVRHIMMEGEMYGDEGAGRSAKYEEEGAGRGDMYKDVGVNAGRRRRPRVESRRSRRRPPARTATPRGSRRSTGSSGTRCGQGRM